MAKKLHHAGVQKHHQCDRWVARINHLGKAIYIGLFDTEEDATEARIAKEIEMGVITSVTDLDGEEWRDSPTLGEGYMVSNKGRIKSLSYMHRHYPNLLKQSISRCKRYFILVHKDSCYLVHRLIAEAFIGHDDRQVNHMDGNGFNNDSSNLEYVNNRENTSHRFHGAKGASFEYNKWRAYIRVDGGNQIKLGRYNTYEEAHQRYIDALAEYGLVNKYVREEV